MTSCYLTGVGKTSLMLRMVDRQLPSNDLLLPHRRGEDVTDAEDGGAVAAL